VSDETAVTVAPWPKVDFAAFGDIEVTPLSRIQSLTGTFLARNWALIPHVTHQDEADVTTLEAVRKSLPAQESGIKITALAFQVKACALALTEFPNFNASLDVAAGLLIRKKYVHIGVAVETAAGLLVPVVRDCDKKPVGAIAEEIAVIAAKARSRGLSVQEMSGGCFSISSLGPSGGTGFSPIINAPEVAMLGISRLIERPARAGGGQIEWRKVVPLSLSYDHRVLNGMDAARFISRLRELLTQPEALLGA
jgi:pyruvate dehydrogenase E2 component (dihydrolipoamide acetyltransferase)